MPATYWATTPAINCSGYTAVSLDFWLWLGVGGSHHAHAYVQVSNNGTNWTTVFQNPTTFTADTSWGEQAADISAVAANQPTVYIRWGLGPTDLTRTYCGWNIDDVTVAGLRTTLPTVSNLTPSVATVAQANAGTATFALTATFAEAMNTSVVPTVSFPIQNPGGTLTFDAGTSGWTNATTYVARFDVANAGVAIPNIDVRVAGAVDMAGNVRRKLILPTTLALIRKAQPSRSIWPAAKPLQPLRRRSTSPSPSASRSPISPPAV